MSTEDFLIGVGVGAIGVILWTSYRLMQSNASITDQSGKTYQFGEQPPGYSTTHPYDVYGNPGGS